MSGMVKKSKAWAKHGKHKGLLGLSIAMNRKAKKQKPEMAGSISELMEKRRDP